MSKSLNPNASAFIPPWMEQAPTSATPDSLPASTSSATPTSTAPTTSATPSTTNSPKASAKSSPAKLNKTNKVPEPEKVPELTVEEQAVVQEFFAGQKDHLNIVFIGHVDAGKSTMGGQILHLTGMVDKRTLEKYEREAKEAGRESWYLSWALDTNKEERAKGKTVEVGKAHFETEKRKYTILDAPGHKNYVPNMIGGASQADVAVLVISARRGEFETGFERGGQTREHAMLVKTTGVKKLIVVINKMDDPTVQWAKIRYEECKDKLLPYLRQCGYNPKTDLEFLPVSGFSGANIKDRVDQNICPFYNGPSLIELLDSIPVDHKLAMEPLLMPIADKHKDMGTNIMGKIEAGTVKQGGSVLLVPNNIKGEIVSVFVDDTEVPAAQAGDNVTVKVKGIEEEDVVSGAVLCSVANPVSAVTTFEAQLFIIESKSIIAAGFSAVLHIHNAIEEMVITELLHSVDKKTGRRTKKPPQFVKRGAMCIAKIEVARPVVAARFRDNAILGRFTIRSESTTIAMGKVVKLCPSV